VIDAHGVCISADLAGIAYTRLEAGPHDAGFGCVLGIEAVIAEAFVAISGCCVGEAARVAVVDTDLY
jgi:hypothetical protein